MSIVVIAKFKTALNRILFGLIAAIRQAMACIIIFLKRNGNVEDREIKVYALPGWCDRVFKKTSVLKDGVDGKQIQIGLLKGKIASVLIIIDKEPRIKSADEFLFLRSPDVVCARIMVNGVVGKYKAHTRHRLFIYKLG